MPDIKPQSKIKLFWKARRVDRILKKINPVLKRDIGDVAKIALMRKSDESLKILENKIKSKRHYNKPQLRNRIGCIFLEFGEDSIQI